MKNNVLKRACAPEAEYIRLIMGLGASENADRAARIFTSTKFTSALIVQERAQNSLTECQFNLQS
jgi:hypothetical protein